tara:strand:- start:208 stop:576 length:369 start_codon:yes stop_codon:yes gene_type:complete
MAAVTLTFSAPLNVSCQVGDTAYYVAVANDGGFLTNGSDNIVEIGQIRQITNGQTSTPTIICESDIAYNLVNGVTSFILFSKNNKVNLSSVLGYYAEAKFVNNSKTESEIFSAAMDVFDSSK